MYQLHQACLNQLNAVKKKKVNLSHEARVTGEISFAGQFLLVTLTQRLKLISKQKSLELESSGISFTLALHEVESKSKKIIL